MTDPAATGMVRCMDCARQVKADKGGRMREVCTADRSRPSLVVDKWRRCADYIPRVKKK